jgi:hypothetical protein
MHRRHFVLVDGLICSMPTHVCVLLYPCWVVVGLACFQRHRHLRAHSYVTGAINEVECFPRYTFSSHLPGGRARQKEEDVTLASPTYLVVRKQ